jgi:hypothetical protein
MQEFEKFRNDVIHGLWVYFPEGSKQVALLRRKSFEQRVDGDVPEFVERMS